jgi:TM2 domain-containing membrane protein YozV
MSNNGSSLEKVLWSIAIPGFGQFLNKKYIKGIALILLEFIINVKANINTLIVLSFYGQTELAVQQADYQWLMFYPCVYIYSIWDPYRDSRENVPPLLSIPFAISANRSLKEYNKGFREDMIVVWEEFGTIYK